MAFRWTAVAQQLEASSSDSIVFPCRYLNAKIGLLLNMHYRKPESEITDSYQVSFLDFLEYNSKVLICFNHALLIFC